MPPLSSSLIPNGSLMERLCAKAIDQWDAYTNHAFVRGLANGTLPEKAFRHYLIQDYLFLIHFARAYGLAVFKSENLNDMRAAAGTLSGILDVELGLHTEYCRDWGLKEEDIVKASEDLACTAYTRFVLERGLAGDILDLYVALSPCVVGYGVIGEILLGDPNTKWDGNPYRSWIEMYSGAEYKEMVQSAVFQLDQLEKRRGGGERFSNLLETFRIATSLEIDFWQMGLNKVVTR